MSLYNKIASVLAPKPVAKVSPSFHEIVDDLERDIVAKYAVGNIYLQRKQFRSFDRKIDIPNVDFKQYMIPDA
ncbi:MAG: hypothetical protein LBC63_10065 [Holophagales bacterium]|jgi:hypothetical protein|nr:hypothetical protein [Holophagales bacterium]